MNVSVHNVTSIEAEQSRYWSNKECEFHRLRIEVRTDDGLHVVELFSSKPMTLVNPQIRVVD